MPHDTSPWLAACRAHVAGARLSPDVLDVLEAFPRRGSEPTSSAGDLAAYEAHLLPRVGTLVEAISVRLAEEVDAAQAAMFARRFGALFSLLNRLSQRVAEARVLRVGALARVEEILADPGPRALRVRALVDFYTSHAAVLHHRHARGGRPVPTLEGLVDAITWAEVDGVEHAALVGDTDLGPVRVNVLRATAPRLEVVDCRTLPDAGLDLPGLVARRGARAATSGGFFLYSEPDIRPPSRRTDPVGLLLRGGEVHNPPVFRRAALCQDAQGALHLGPIGLAGVEVSWEGGGARIVGVNRPWDGAPTAWNRAGGPASPDHGGPTLAVVGGTVTAVGRGALSVPLAGYVLALPPGGALPSPGTRVHHTLPPALGGARLREGIAGGPMLVEPGRTTIELAPEDFAGTAPPATFSQDETSDANLLPRLAAGLDSEGRLVLAAMDGRNFLRAPGFTLRMAARLMRRLGCTVAMNLDGGSSKRMVVGGRVVDLPTTELVTSEHRGAPVRPVHTAVLIS